MTREQCIEAFAYLLDRDASINGNEVILSFDSHTVAIGALRHARDALKSLANLNAETMAIKTEQTSPSQQGEKP